MKTLTSSFFSTLSAGQLKQVLKFFWPPSWLRLKSGPAIKELETELAALIGVKRAVSFYNARAALYWGLKALGVKSDDEVILQAYTCVSVPNAIMALGARPVYVDISLDDLNIDPEKIEEKINTKTKAVIVQHTFGTPADLTRIKAILDKYQVALVEDCAHALGARYQGRLVGSFGKFSVFSFGRDKVISGVNGGALCSNDDDIITGLPKNLPWPSLITIKQNLLYPVVATLSRLSYDFLGLGKVLITLAKKLKIIPSVTSARENRCQDRRILQWRLPNCLAILILARLKKLTEINNHRKNIAQFYFERLTNSRFSYLYKYATSSDSIYLRLVVFSQSRTALFDYCKKQRVILGNWYDQVIAPRSVAVESAGYQPGSCPRAEQAAALTLNLPNHPGITLADARRVVDLLNNFKS